MVYVLSSITAVSATRESLRAHQAGRSTPRAFHACLARRQISRIATRREPNSSMILPLGSSSHIHSLQKPCRSYLGVFFTETRFWITRAISFHAPPLAITQSIMAAARTVGALWSRRRWPFYGILFLWSKPCPIPKWGMAVPDFSVRKSTPD